MSKFFAMLDRMKYIERWGLMRSNVKENVAEHSLQVAMIAHCLSVIGRKYFARSADSGNIAVLAMYHESSEVLTGDLPAPIKYYNPSIKEAYKNIERTANERLIDLLPEELKNEYRDIIITDSDSYEYRIVKAADKISALIKCIDELKAGNREFLQARNTLELEIKALELPEVRHFMDNFIAEYELTLDELSAHF